LEVFNTSTEQIPSSYWSAYLSQGSSGYIWWLEKVVTHQGSWSTRPVPVPHFNVT